MLEGHFTRQRHLALANLQSIECIEVGRGRRWRRGLWTPNSLCYRNSELWVEILQQTRFHE